MKKRILILGIHGFLGRALAKYLKLRFPQSHIFGISRKKRTSNRNIHTCEINNKLKLKSILIQLKPQWIFHMAGGRRKSAKKMFKDNVLSTIVLCEAILSIEGYSPRVIIPGSAAEYGVPSKVGGKVNENHRIKPKTDYGKVKARQTKEALKYSNKGVDIVIARIFNIIGENVPRDLSIGKFAENIVQIEKNVKKPILKTMNLDGKRDFLDIQDACNALILTAQKGKFASVYNVCSGESTSIRDMLMYMIHLCKVSDISVIEMKSNDIGSSTIVGDNKRIKNTLGWKRKVSMEHSLENTLKYYRRVIEKKIL